MIFAYGGAAGGRATVERLSDLPGADEVAGRAPPSVEGAPDRAAPDRADADRPRGVRAADDSARAVPAAAGAAEMAEEGALARPVATTAGP